jgi:hypothetical protein
MLRITYAADFAYLRHSFDEARVAELIDQLQQGKSSLLASDRPKTSVERTLQLAHSPEFLMSFHIVLARSRAARSGDAPAAAASHGTKTLEGLMLGDLAVIARTETRRLADGKGNRHPYTTES